MEKINKKQCLKCQSFNVFDTGDKTSNVGDMGPNGEYQQPDISIYECNDCKERFVYHGE